MSHTLHCSLEDLRSIGCGSSVVFYRGADLDVDAKNNPKTAALRRTVEEMLNGGRAVHLCRPVHGHEDRRWCEHSIIGR